MGQGTEDTILVVFQITVLGVVCAYIYTKTQTAVLSTQRGDGNTEGQMQPE